MTWKNERDLPECDEMRACFGKSKSGKRCRILTETYQDGKCPFCKEKRDITDGKYYPYQKNYAPVKA